MNFLFPPKMNAVWNSRSSGVTVAIHQLAVFELLKIILLYPESSRHMCQNSENVFSVPEVCRLLSQLITVKLWIYCKKSWSLCSLCSYCLSSKAKQIAHPPLPPCDDTVHARALSYCVTGCGHMSAAVVYKLSRWQRRQDRTNVSAGNEWKSVRQRGESHLFKCMFHILETGGPHLWEYIHFFNKTAKQYRYCGTCQYILID